MSKTSSLVKNTAIIGFGTLSTKALTFLLLPLYTRVLVADDYGLIDVLMTISSLVIPFAVLEMNSGVFRFLIGSKDGNNHSIKAVISTGYSIEAIGLLITLLLILVINAFYSIPHCFAFLFYVLSLAISKLTLDTTRGYGDTTTYSIANIIITSISLFLNVVLIVVLKWSAVAILIASSIGNFSGAIFLLFKEHIYRDFSRKHINKLTSKEMMRYTLPLIPNTVSWWIASASDRLIILMFLGATANGIYAAAHKIPGIYTTIFTVFCLAWTESVARNSSDNKFVENTVKVSVNIMIYMLLGIVACSSLFFELLIGKEYVDCYWHIFILLIAIFFSSLSSLYGGIFGGMMESKAIASTTIIGAIINIIVNLGFVKLIGLYAASISTTVSYIVIALIRRKHITKWYNIKLFSKNDIILIPIACVTIVGFCMHNKICNLVSIVFIIIGFLVNNKSIAKSVFLKVKSVFIRKG